MADLYNGLMAITGVFSCLNVYTLLRTIATICQTKVGNLFWYVTQLWKSLLKKSRRIDASKVFSTQM